MLTPMLLANDYPPDHPVLRAALTPEEAADLLVSSIRQERFLILDSDAGESSLRAKAADYEKWLTHLSSVFSAADTDGTSAGGLRPADPAP